MLNIRFILVSVLLLSACQPEDAPSNQQVFQERREALLSQFQTCERGSTTQAASLVAEARCLLFSVAENPELPDARQIDLKVMILPAIKPQPEADPFVIIVGGPGEAATEAGVTLAPVFAKLRQDRDILLLDQRGTGSLSPFNACDFREDDKTFANETSLEVLLERQTEILNECLLKIDANPEFYSTDIAVQDLEALRVYLGYSELNLWGGSYGTRVALAFLQAYPESTRTVVLDGVAPPAIKLGLYVARDGSAALRKILDRCAQDSECAEAFPDLELHLNSLLANFIEPELINLRNSKTGLFEDVAVTQYVLKSIFRSVLYSREAARLLPLIIEEMYQGNFSTLVALELAGSSAINQGMHLSVVCNEDMSLLSQADIDEALSSDVMLASDMFVTPMLEACKIWPKREITARYFEPVVSDKPVLILSGEQDPVTPPVWGELVAGTLSNSRHLIARGVGHITSRYGCVNRLIVDFVESTDAQSLEAECIDQLQARPFFTNISGGVSDND